MGIYVFGCCSCVTETIDLEREMQLSVFWIKAGDKGRFEVLPGGIFVGCAPGVEPSQRVEVKLGGGGRKPVFPWNL